MDKEEIKYVIFKDGTVYNVPGFELTTDKGIIEKSKELLDEAREEGKSRYWKGEYFVYPQTKRNKKKWLAHQTYTYYVHYFEEKTKSDDFPLLDFNVGGKIIHGWLANSNLHSYYFSILLPDNNIEKYKYSELRDIKLAKQDYKFVPITDSRDNIFMDGD